MSVADRPVTPPPRTAARADGANLPRSGSVRLRGGPPFFTIEGWTLALDIAPPPPRASARCRARRAGGDRRDPDSPGVGLVGIVAVVVLIGAALSLLYEQRRAWRAARSARRLRHRRAAS
jgi:hypothetical protein